MVSRRPLLGRALLAVGLLAGPASSQVPSAVSGDPGLSGRLTNGGTPLTGAVIYLESGSGSVETSPLPPVVIDQEHLRFIPGSVAITPGTRVVFRNSDPVMHNIFSPGPEAFDLGTHGRDEALEWQFRAPGIHVMLCNIHPEMVAYISVVTSPYLAVVGDDGSFRLPDAPPGDYVVHVWLPRRRTRHSLPLTLGSPPNAAVELVVLGGTLTLR